jgi:hypothetical protein
MKLTKEQKKQIEQIVDGLKCPKDFKCYRSGLENLCRATDIGIESLLECLEDGSHACRFATRVGDLRLCVCPLRVYIARSLSR